MVASEKTLEFLAVRFSLADWEEARERFEAIAQSQFIKNGAINDPSPTGNFAFTFPTAHLRNDIVSIPKRPIVCLMSIKSRVNRIICVDIHHKRDFVLLTTAKADDSRKIDVISLSKCSGTVIQVKAKTKIQKCTFHSSKPLIFIMTQNHIFIYELQKQATKKKLVTGAAGLTDLALHKTGDHLLVATSDARVLWFDLDSGQYPYKKMKVHNAQVNSCAFSDSYQLFVSASDSGELVVQHAMVETEYFGYPTITPLKMLSNQFPKGNPSISESKFFRTKYFLAAIGVDGQLMVWA
jgi:ribosome biogenesis protein ERB1